MSLQKVFTKKTWHDDAPPYIDEVEMNARDEAMDQFDDRIINLDGRLGSLESVASGSGSINMAYIVGNTEYSSDWLSNQEGGDPLVPEDNKVYTIMTKGSKYKDSYIWMNNAYSKMPGHINRYSKETINTYDLYNMGSNGSIFFSLPIKETTRKILIIVRGLKSGSMPQWNVYLDGKRLNSSAFGSGYTEFEISIDKGNLGSADIGKTLGIRFEANREGRIGTGYVYEYLEGDIIETDYYVPGGNDVQSKGGLIPASSNEELRFFGSDGEWHDIGVSDQSSVGSKNVNVYKTEDEHVGTWIDGRAVFEKVVSIDGEVDTNTQVIIGDQSYKRFLSCYGNAYSNALQKVVAIPYISESSFICVSANDEQRAINIECDSAGYKNVNIIVKHIGRKIFDTVPSWADATEEEVRDLLTAHYDNEINIYDYWNVGDVRKFDISEMFAVGVSESHKAQTIEMTLVNKGGYKLSDGVTDCAFVVAQKDILTDPDRRVPEQGYIDSSSNYSMTWLTCARRTWCDTIYRDSFSDIVKNQIFKEFHYLAGCKGGSSGSQATNITGYFALPSASEVSPFTSIGVREGAVWELYDPTINSNVDLKKYAYNTEDSFLYFLRSWSGESAMYAVNINGAVSATYSGSAGYSSSRNHLRGIAPFGVI